MVKGDKSRKKSTTRNTNFSFGVSTSIEKRKLEKHQNKERIYKKRGIKSQESVSKLTFSTIVGVFAKIDKDVFKDFHYDAESDWSEHGHDTFVEQHQVMDEGLSKKFLLIFENWYKYQATHSQILEVLDLKDENDKAWWFVYNRIPNLIKHLNTILNFPDRYTIYKVARQVEYRLPNHFGIGDVYDRVIYNFDRERTNAESKILKQALDACKQINNDENKEFSSMVPKNTVKYPLGWMEKDKQITDTMAKKGNRFFYDILNYLDNNKIVYDESIDIIESKGWPTDAILVEINRETIGEKFKIHIRVVGLYLQAMEKAGIIKLLGRQDGYGGRGDNIYQIGKWLQNSLKHRPKPISFLKKSPEFQQALRTFKTQ